MPDPDLRNSEPDPRDASPGPRPDTRREGPERRSTPAPDGPSPTSLPPDAQQGQQKPGGGKSGDPRRERHHVDPGRDEKPDYPKDPSR